MTQATVIQALKSMATIAVRSLLTLIAAYPLSTYAGSTDSKHSISSLNLAATDWCPYSCDSSQSPGFVTEAMTHALAKENITLTVTILPWTRAIKMTEQGQFDGLLTASLSEAPGFHITESPSGEYQVCLYSHPDSSFTHNDRESFNDVILGGIQDYGYGKPIDDIINAPRAAEQIYLLSSSNPLLSLVEMTYKRRIDTFAEDKHVLEHYLKDKENQQLKNSGCLEKHLFFTAISPHYEKRKEAITLLNKLLASDDYKLFYTQAQQRYSAP